MKALSTILSLCFTLVLLGQQVPAARGILNDISDTYNNASSMEMVFDLKVDYPAHESQLQEGRLVQNKEKYVITLEDQDIYCDGVDVLVHLKNDNEVQINDLDEEGDMMSPSGLLTVYESEDFDYILEGQVTENGMKYNLIQFKPTDRDSEYSKISLMASVKNNDLHELVMYMKDGSKMTLSVKNIYVNKQYDQEIFTFAYSEHPEIHIEDLRID